MKNYTYQNNLIGKKQLRQLLAWSFTNYDSMQACTLADELKYLGFKYASQAGISISIEDLKIPFVKNLILKKLIKKLQTRKRFILKEKLQMLKDFKKLLTLGV
jgi:DNA-directed RNA polymerase subunit beta'